MLKYIRAIYLLVSLCLFLPLKIDALPASGTSIVINEIQTGSTASASEEFIELYNASDTAINVSNYKLEYFSAGTTIFSSPSRTILLHGTLNPSNYYLVASSGYLSGSSHESFSATLAKSGGHLRLVSTNAFDTVTVHDLVGWGTATTPETAAAPAPNEGQSIQRLIDSTGQPIDTDNNLNDLENQRDPITRKR